MLDIKDFVSNGFKKYTGEPIGKECCDFFAQKRITDDMGTKYFINVYFYDMSAYKVKFPFSIQAEVQFRKDDDTFDVTLLQVKSIEQMESYFDEMWTKMNFDYYEKN